MNDKLQPALDNESVIKQAKAFDNVTRRVVLPTAWVSIILGEKDTVTVLFNLKGQLYPVAMLDEAYLQLLKQFKLTEKESKEKFEEESKEGEKLFNEKHAVWIGWINSQLTKKKLLQFIVRQGVVAGVATSSIRPAPLTFMLNEVTKYGDITHYLIGNYEQVFIFKRKKKLWAFVYSDVNKYPPVLYENVSIEDGELTNFDKIHEYTGKGKMVNKFPAFIEDIFRKR